jgi:plastocyanin
LVLLAIALAGCGGTPRSNAAPTTAAGVGRVTVAPDGVQEITLQTQDDYVFTPDHFTVAPGKVRLTVTNVAKQATHAFEFRPDSAPTPIDASIPLLAPGEEKTIDFDVETPGDYPFQCSFHVQLGQVGTMTVRS